MVNNIAPTILSSLVPPLVQSVSHYNLRNANDLQSVNSRTTQYFNSFLPSVIREWNSLPCADRNVETIDSFKWHLNQHRATYRSIFTLKIETHKFCIPDSDWGAVLLIMTFS